MKLIITLAFINLAYVLVKYEIREIKKLKNRKHITMKEIYKEIENEIKNESSN